MPRAIGDRTLYPKERMTEIQRCKSDKAKREKYWVWVLLEKALKEALNIDIANLKFTKMPSGKWIADGCYFSLSHTDGAMAVAVSESPVGVDIERVREVRRGLGDKILTEREMAHQRALGDDEKREYLLDKWCEKEAIFKAGEGNALLPRTIETSEHETQIKRVTIGDQEYIVCVYGQSK